LMAPCGSHQVGRRFSSARASCGLKPPAWTHPHRDAPTDCIRAFTNIAAGTWSIRSFSIWKAKGPGHANVEMLEPTPITRSADRNSLAVFQGSLFADRFGFPLFPKYSAFILYLTGVSLRL
jgi:hypothetical protein